MRLSLHPLSLPPIIQLSVCPAVKGSVAKLVWPAVVWSPSKEVSPKGYQEMAESDRKKKEKQEMEKSWREKGSRKMIFADDYSMAWLSTKLSFND